MVGTQGVQPLPEKVTAIKALKPPTDIDELRQFLGLVGFYRKFISFFADVTACLNTAEEGHSLHVNSTVWQCLQVTQIRFGKNA